MVRFDWRPPTLETDRLILRPFDESDAEPLFPLAANPHVTRYTLWDHHRTIADTLTFVHDYALSRYAEEVPEPLAVVLKDDRQRRPVGVVGCFWVSRPNRTMELGYWLGEPYWGQGLTGEACRAVVGHAFRACGPARVQARVIAGNAASSRVLDKLGFRYEGTLRASLVRREKVEDVLMYSVLQEEWGRW